MAKTFYKYAERDAENRIDWSEVAKNMNDVLSAELKERRQKKRKIEEAQEESLKYVENAPQGQHVGKDEFVLDYAEKVMETMRIQHQLLKEGKLSLKDYNIQRANIMNGTKEFYEVAENWNTTYDEAKKMLDEGNLSEFSQSILMDVEKMGNFTNHSLYINPIDGQVSIGERQLTNPDEPYDPETNPYTTVVVPNENSLRPLQELNNRQDQLLAPFDLEGSLDESANMLADTYEQLLKADPTQSVNDIRENENYVDAETTIINSQVGDNNSFNAVSILTDMQGEVLDGYDNAGEQFDFTSDPNDPRLFNADGSRNQSMILRVQDPNQPNSGRLVPQLTDEQLEMAREITKDRLDVMVNRSVTRKTEWAPSQWEYLANEKSEQEQALLTNLIDLFSGDEADMESTMAGLMDLPGNEWIQTIERNNEEIVINRGMANQEIIPLYTAGVIDGIPGGEEWTEEQFLKAVASKLGGFDNYAMAMEVFKKLQGGDDYVASTLTTDITEPIIYTRKTDPPGPDALRVDPLMEIDEPGITAAFQDLFDDPDFTNPTIGQTFAYLDEFYDDEIKNWTDYVPAVTSLITEVLQKGLRNNDVGIRPQDIVITSNEDGKKSTITVEIKGRNQPPRLFKLSEGPSRGMELLRQLTEFVDGLLLKRSDLLPPEDDSRIEDEDNAPQ
tara:strand:- start:18609 stop:20624 length:2016 start_codon:yes stop_codon:yes gene_type:complete